MIKYLSYLAIAAWIAIMLYCPMDEVTYYHPDSTERIAASINYLENSQYTIKVDNQDHPPRYSPAFSN